MDTAISLTKWYRPAGVELTFQSARVKTLRAFNRWEYNLTPHGREADIVRLANLVDKSYLTSKLPSLYDPESWPIHEDDQCIEAPTKILRSWNDAQTTITQILDAAHSIKLTDKSRANPTKRYSNFSTGGGGHVHLGFPNTTRGLAQRFAIWIDLQNRPYLPWFFADPDNTLASNNAIDTSGFGFDTFLFVPRCNNWMTTLYRFQQKSTQELLKFISYNRAKLVSPVTLPKSLIRLPEIFPSVVTSKSIHSRITLFNTIEYRFFDTGNSWNHFENLLAFSQAHAKFVCDRLDNGRLDTVRVKNWADLSKYRDYDRCVNKFKKLIVRDLHLPWERYTQYERNLQERFTSIDLLT